LHCDRRSDDRRSFDSRTHPVLWNTTDAARCRYLPDGQERAAKRVTPCPLGKRSQRAFPRLRPRRLALSRAAFDACPFMLALSPAIGPRTQRPAPSADARPFQSWNRGVKVES